MIDIHECLVFPYSPEVVISHDLVGFMIGRVRDGITTKVKVVLDGEDPGHITDGTIGYYAPYGMAYMACPGYDRGLIGIDFTSKRLIFSQNDTSFNHHRDSVVYSTPENIYVRESFENVLAEFQEQRYIFWEFAPKNIGDRLIRYRNFDTVDVGLKMQMEQILESLKVINKVK